MSKRKQFERQLPAVQMAKVFAPSFGDRPPSPPEPDLRDDDDDSDDFVVELELDGEEYVRHFDVSQRLMEWLDDGGAPGGDDKHHAK